MSVLRSASDIAVICEMPGKMSKAYNFATTLVDHRPSKCIVIVDNFVLGSCQMDYLNKSRSAQHPEIITTAHLGGHLIGAEAGNRMRVLRFKLSFLIAVWTLMIPVSELGADQIPVHHIEGVALGFLVLRNLDGQALAYGDYTQVVKPDGLVMDDLRFEFKDGSLYEEITRFTQRGKFRLVSDQVEQKGPSFKQASESWIDARTGTITVRTTEKGEEKTTTKHLDLPEDVSNGLLFVFLKNVDPSAKTTVSFVVASTKPRVVKWDIVPGQEKTIKVGFRTQKAQHYVVKTRIQGPAGAIAPLIGKQPPDIHVWLAKSQAPTFVEFEGPLSEDTPVWRIELAAPEQDSQSRR